MIKFIKMQGCANDYIYIDCLDGLIPENVPALAIEMSVRHFSVGGDGVVLICPSKAADVKMRMFNADGTEGKMCGNAIRCVGKYVYEKTGCDKIITVETLAGIKTLYLNIVDGKVKTVKVDMGAAVFECEKIPVNLDGFAVNRTVFIAGKERSITCVSMGNPHCVVFCDDVFSLDLAKIGPLYETDPVFPEGVNTEFIKVADETHLQMRVWERGSGETYACGTGACAAVSAAVRLGYCKAGVPITVKLLGGELTITYTEKTVYMEGAAKKVYEGVYYED